MKITMLGVSGSGKTTYMAALNEVLRLNRVEDFYITPTVHSFEEGISQMGRFEELTFSNNNYKFPAGTQKTTLWAFDFIHKNQRVSEFEWIDYRGGTLNDIYKINQDPSVRNQVNELFGHIVISDALLIFADAIKLTRYNKPNERILHSGARIINEVMRLYNLQHPYKRLTIVILLAKVDSDLIDYKWKDNDYALLKKIGLETFNEVVSIIRSNSGQWTGGIVPVGSIGEGNVKSAIKESNDFRKPFEISTIIENIPEPINAYNPLFFCVGTAR